MKTDLTQKIPWNLVWLASYPKSGNTWFRVFLTNYLRDSDAPADINALEHSVIASGRYRFDTLYGIDSSDLGLEEIDHRRPAMYDRWQKNPEQQFHKVHDGYTYLSDGRPLLGNPQGQAVIYFVRNPLDVAVSFAHHCGEEDIDCIIKNMADEAHCFCNSKRNFTVQLRQKLLSWSSHIRSWQTADMPKLFLRYEDMLLSSEESFAKAIAFLGLPKDQTRLRKAIDRSSFKTLQQQEQAVGFHEKSPVAKSFFRKGESGSYRGVLTEKQIQQIIEDHRTVMQELNYIAVATGAV